MSEKNIIPPSNDINDKVKINAKAAYLMIFISSMFLLNKENPYIHNTFVKNHTKTAFLIHMIFLLIYIVFIHYWLFNILVFWYSLNYIIAWILFILNFFLLIVWVYNAHIWKTFKIWNILKISEKEEIFNLKEVKIWEKDKATFILTFIPFLWYIIYSKYKINNLVKNICKFNLTLSLIITFLFIYWHESLGLLLILAYIVFVVFFSLLLVFKNSILVINLYFLPTFEEIEENIIVVIKYILNYFKKWSFIEFKKLLEQEKLEKKQIEEAEIIELKDKKDIKINKNLIYLPIFNFIFLFYIKTKYRFHIINWIYISILFIIFFFLFWNNPNYFIILIFPIFYWIWFLQTKLNYKMPFIYKFHILIMKILFLTKKTTSIIQEKHKEENIVSLKVDW